MRRRYQLGQWKHETKNRGGLKLSIPWLILFQIDDEIAANDVSVILELSLNTAAKILPSTVIKHAPSTPSLSTDFSTSGSFLAAIIAI
jgi:hypothetical protein